MAITGFYFHLSPSITHKTKSLKGRNKQSFTLSHQFVNKVRYIYKTRYKATKYRPKTCYYKQSSYLCSVFSLY